MDFYSKTKRNTKALHLIPMEDAEMKEIADKFSKIAGKYKLPIETCSEAIDLSSYGIKRGKCIDDRLITKILGCKLNVKKDDTQRDACGCVKSVDIGQYNTCRHHCLYCYANFNEGEVEENYLKHNKNTPLLIGEVRHDAKITERNMKSIKIQEDNTIQISLKDLN